MTRVLRLWFLTPVLLSGPALADPSDGFNHPHMYGDFGAGMVLGPIFMLLLLAALVVAIVALIRWLSPDAMAGKGSGRAALEALDLRFAKGEIDSEEYANRKKLLT